MPSTATKSKGLSLHIGLNSVDPAGYGGWPGTLNACENDARDMEAIASARGFKTKILLTKDATTTNVVNFLKAAAKQLAKGDELFLTYSGHGGQVPDKNGDETSDGLDETWALYDRQLVDDELYAMWALFAKGVRILMLSDSCHSGSVAKAMVGALAGGPQIPIRDVATVDYSAFAVRAIPIENLGPAYVAQQKVYDKIQKKYPTAEKTPVGASVVLISGCQDNQTSLDGAKNGLFTEKLLTVWNGGSFKGTLKSFHKAIVAQMPFTQTPNYFVTGPKNAKFEAGFPFTI
ncbi:MAG TPA: caspase family protein [Thermoanaerobaculia bacterium]|nr:caspase family protein [Thermoanaerobaculia bacterium]